MSHGHADSEPCGLNCPVGPVRIHLETPALCNHSGRNTCPICAELTDDEVAALREYFALLRAASPPASLDGAK